MAKKAATKVAETVEVKDINVQLELKTITIPIRGIAPLIMSRFDAKSAQEIKDKTPGQAKQRKKELDSPEELYARTIYYLADGKSYGMPAVAFKAAMVRAAQVVYEQQLVKTRTLFRVIADDPATGLVKINGTPRMREDMVRIGSIQKVAAPRYRAEFPEWSANLTIQYVAGQLSEQQIVSYVNAAGFCCGVGEWRPEKSASGSFGLFQVMSDAA